MNQRPQQPRRTSRRTNPYPRYAGIAFIVLGIGLGTFTLYQQYTTRVSSAQTVQLPATTTPNLALSAYDHVAITGKAAIVYDISTGHTIYAQNANAQLPLASLTKLLTLYAASGVLSAASTVTMTPLALSQGGDAADYGFNPGETFRFQDIARLTLAASSNDGAEAIAEAASAVRAVPATSLLAGAAAAAGLLNTHVNNGTGLDVNTTISGGYGSAHDIAVLAGKLLHKNPTIAQATTQSSVSITSLQGDVHTFANTNPDITNLPNPLLSKTGYTDLAGGNLVVVYDAGINHPVAIVVLGSTQQGRFDDVEQLMHATLIYFAGTSTPK